MDGLVSKVAIITTRWNTDIVAKLRSGALLALKQQDIAERQCRHIEVAGALEIPLACRQLQKKGCIGIVALGCVIRGQTSHYDLVTQQCFRGIMDVQLQTGIAIGTGVLAVENKAQALARAQPIDPETHSDDVVHTDVTNAGYAAAKAMLQSVANHQKLVYND